jgi:type I restriction enzyme S subunit
MRSRCASALNASIAPGWKVYNLGELGRWVGGGTPSRSNEAFWRGGVVPWVSPKDMKSLRITGAEEWITEEAVRDSSTTKVEPGGLLLVTRSGILRRTLPVGIACRTVAINQDLKALLPCQLLDPQYGLHLLVGNSDKILRTCLKDGTTVESLELDEIKGFDVIIPPLEEQRRIAEILDTADKEFQLLDCILQKTVARRQALMQQVLTGKTRFVEFKGVRWRKVQIGELLEPRNRYEEWDDGRLYRLAGVRRKGGGLFFRDELPGTRIKVKVCKKIKAGDFLISRRQMTYGGMAMVPPEFGGFDVNDEYEVLVVRDSADFDMRFFDYLSETPELKYAALVASNGFFAERLRLNLDLDQFLSHRISVPPCREELQQIVALLDAATGEIVLLEKQLAALKEQKRGLMQKLLTGEVRVKTC